MSPLMEVLKKQNKKTDLLTTWTVFSNAKSLHTEANDRVPLKTSTLIKLESPSTDIPLWPDLTAVPRCQYTTTIIATVLMFLRIVSKVCVSEYECLHFIY